MIFHGFQGKYTPGEQTVFNPKENGRKLDKTSKWTVSKICRNGMFFFFIFRQRCKVSFLKTEEPAQVNVSISFSEGENVSDVLYSIPWSLPADEISKNEHPIWKKSENYTIVTPQLHSHLKMCVLCWVRWRMLQNNFFYFGTYWICALIILLYRNRKYCRTNILDICASWYCYIEYTHTGYVYVFHYLLYRNRKI